MSATPVEFQVDDGVLAGLDFGGRGTPVLLVHGTGHNASAWHDVAGLLTPHCRVLAIDLRGHGQTLLESTTAEQYWRDLGEIGRALDSRPLLVGHSTGGYAVCAATAAGLVEPLALCVVDGFVLDERATAIAAQASNSAPDALSKLRDTLRYGWLADGEQMAAYVDECVHTRATDWLNAGASPELVRRVMRRAFVRRDDRWLRRPTLEEIAIVSSPDPDATTYPSLELYASIRCPITFVLASDGFYHRRRDELDRMIAATPGSRRVDIDANHNVPMTRPAELAEVILAAARSARGAA
jgi:pimeloyl-ACP methyl ester carboxylesterase